MDPLSITTGILALIGGANQIAKGINKLASLRGAPASILALNNELSDFRLVLEESKGLLTENNVHEALYKAKVPSSEVSERLMPSLRSAWECLHELEAIEKRISTHSVGIGRLVWLWEQENIHRVQKGLRSSRVDIVAVLSIISS